MILSIIEQLEVESGKNRKIEILQEHSENILLKRVFAMTLDPFITFGIKNIELNLDEGNNLHLEEALNVIWDEIVGTQRSGNSIAVLDGILSNVNKRDRVIIERLIKKDLRCGVSTSTINKIWPKLIPEFKVLKAQPSKEKYLNNIKYPAYSQRKLDGARCNINFHHDGSLEILSSSGRNIETFNRFGCLSELFSGYMIDGELIAKENGQFIDRKRSNGIVTKAIRGTISPNEAKKLVLVVWDVVPMENVIAQQPTTTFPYEQRLALLHRKLTYAYSDCIELVDTFTVNSLKDAQAHFLDELAQGQEGIIIKNTDSQWVRKRSNDLVKMKAENTADLMITGVIEGTGKYEGMLGAVVLETNDGLLKVSCGSGFTDSQRQELFNEYIIGKIVEVKYNELIKSKGDKKMSLFLPIFKRIRDDKTVADNLDNLK